MTICASGHCQTARPRYAAEYTTLVVSQQSLIARELLVQPFSPNCQPALSKPHPFRLDEGISRRISAIHAVFGFLAASLEVHAAVPGMN